MIRELDDDQAVVAMVDFNLHRENLKPSEKAGLPSASGIAKIKD